MKMLIAILMYLLPLAVIGQPNFFIKGRGYAFKNGDKIYLVYKRQGKVVFDSTIVKLGSFKFNGHVKAVSKAQIYRNENPMELEVVKEVIEFYAEPGKILILCNNSLADATVSGTTINEDNHRLNDLLRPYLQKRVNLSKNFNALTTEQQKDINYVASYRAADKRILAEMVPVQLKFIAAHPDSYVSLVTLKQMLKNKIMLPEVENAYTDLSNVVKASETGKEIAQTITSLKKELKIGTTAYNFTLPDTAGKPVSLADFAGKYVLIDFWASWCLPCREENPNIILAYNKFKDKGFTVLSVSVENNNERKNWLKAIREDHLPWTQVLDGEKTAAKIKTFYGITTIPANMLISPMGKIIAKDLKDKVLLNKLTELLGEPSVN